MRYSKILLKSVIIGWGVFFTSPVLAQWTNPKSGTLKTSSGLPSSGIDSIVSNLMFWMLSLVGFLAIVGFIISGILYLTAAGNDKQVTSAKNAMTFSIIGVIVALLGYVVVLAASNWLDGSSSF